MEELTVEVVVKVGKIEIKKEVSVEIFKGNISQEMFDRAFLLLSKLTCLGVLAELS